MSCIFILFMRLISSKRTYLISWKIKSKISKLSDHRKTGVIFHKLQLCLIRNLCLYSYRNGEIERLLTLTDSFTWEEMPTRDPETGNITAAGYIAIIQSRTKNLVSFGGAFYSTMCAVRIVMSHEMIYPIWFPIEASWSPLYEIINLIQVMFILQR
jgi:hypothetical protein